MATKLTSVQPTASRRYSRLQVCATVVCLALLGTGFFATRTRADDLDAAFSSLTNGRVYLRGFGPPLNQKTRRGLVADFIGANGQTPNRPSLIEAVQRAVVIRNGEPLEPDSFPSGQAPRSVQAKVIAWEALESLLTGYQYAGNRDLLDATRVAYPGSNPANDTRQMPAEESTVFPGTAQKQITYARLYFLQGIKDVLEYIAEDRTGHLRAGSTLYGDTVPHYVAFDHQQSEILPFPRFDDLNFGSPVDATSDQEPCQSVAYLYGSAMERFGLSAVAYADQLWRSAYAGPGAGAKRTEAEKNQMLDRAADVLKCNIHAQFLAALPLAAQLSDGSDGSANEFQQSRINQARVSVTSAQRLREQILAGEKPTQSALVSAWDVVSIEQQIGSVKNAFTAAKEKMENPGAGHVLFEVQRAEDALSLDANREIELRNSLETQLKDITGIDPSLYGSLRSEPDQKDYLKAVQDKFDELINGQDPSAEALQDGGSLMSVQALRLIQALREVFAKKAYIASFGQKMRIELERNHDENATIIVNSLIFSVIDTVIAAADAVETSTTVCACGMASGVSQTVTTKPGVPATLAQVALRTIRLAGERVIISSINSDAVIRNLMIDQQTAIEELPIVALNSAIAGTELRRLFANAARLVENHVFYQNITDTLWYRDPSLAFKLEKAEEEYLALTQNYRIELYKLARMLEAAWGERFANPVSREGSPPVEPLNNGSFDEFTEAESVFGVPGHAEGKAFYDALQKWDLVLRTAPYRKAYDATLRDVNSFAGQPLSLRRDIFKLIDYRYDFVGNRYEVDTTLTRQSIQRFRAVLLNLAQRDPKNTPNALNQLRIDFPITYNQTRVILGQQNPVPMVQRVVPFGEFEPWWNHRVREIGIKIVGRNVFAGASTVPVRIELFGNVDRVGYFPDSLFTKSRVISTFPVPLYLRDPDKRLVAEPFFGSVIDAAIGSTPVTPYSVQQTWPLFCDNIVLRIGNALGTLRIENIEDIEFYMKMETGSPPPITAGIW